KYLVALGDGTLEYISGVEKRRSESSVDSSVTQMIAENPLSKYKLDYNQFRHFQRNNRAHGNFAENVPLSLLLLFFIEVNNYISPFWLHVACGNLLLGRIIHGDLAFNLFANHLAVNKWRPIGVSINLIVLTFAALVNGYNFLSS
ncbi:14851_t:CDS:2, partial [Funneliformis caledonium]